MRILVAALTALPVVVHAQTDYFNTDRGRPLHVQDAIAIERYAREFQFYPVRVAHRPGGTVWWLEPSLTLGVLPRTQLELAVPLRGASSQSFGSFQMALLHALNVETLGVPALALSAAVDFSGSFRTHATLGALATRTTTLGRVHVNADATIGQTLRGYSTYEPWLIERARWTIGAAVDRALPLRSMLFSTELVVRRPMIGDGGVEWQTATGLRVQLNPTWVLDGSYGWVIDREREWSMTVGVGQSLGRRRRDGGRR